VLRRIDIEGFRGFAKLSADLGPVSVLLGPNSSGKSSVLQAVRLACSALAWTLRQEPDPRVDGEWIAIWWDYPIGEDEAFLPAVSVEELFLNKGDEPLVLSLGFDDDDYIQELRVTLRYGRADALRLDVRVKSRKALDATTGVKSKKGKLLASALLGKEPIAVAIPSFYGVVREEPYINNARLERLLGAGEQGGVVRNLVGRLDALKELSDLLLLSVGAEIVRSTSGQAMQEIESLVVQFRDRNGELELSSAGTGLVALTALFSALRWYQPRAVQGRPLLFLLDEPEAHLHPRLQGDTGERLAELVTSFGGQALVATHSVEMINRLGRRPDAVLLSIDRSAADAAVRLTTEDDVIERLESFCDLSPFVGLQLLRSRRVLFHEGKTDRAILEGCARAYFANDPARLDRFRRWTFVELSSETNADAKDVLKKALAPLAASAGAEPIRIVRALDRDYHRRPVLGPEQGDANLREYDVVWSRYSIESLFLEPPCLAAWIRLGLDGRPHAPAATALDPWVAEGIASANADPEMNEWAADRLFLREVRKLTVGETHSDKAMIEARQEAKRRVAAEPEVYQSGHQRARHVLAAVRGRLHASLQNRVRRDVADVVRYAPSATTLTSPALVPREIEELLKYLAT
jgi:hypothetical protein